MTKPALTLALAAGMIAPLATPVDAGNFDGTWSVELVTESGSLCDARYSYSLAVQDGHVRPVTKAASSGATVSGHVNPDGSVGLSVSSSAASGSASGRLKAMSGSGTWKVSSLCTGRWTARRHTQRTAQAE